MYALKLMNNKCTRRFSPEQLIENKNKKLNLVCKQFQDNRKNSKIPPIFSSGTSFVVY